MTKVRFVTPETARELLQFHSGAHAEVEDPRWTHGFLGMLRPYHGLCEENFHSVMACLRVLAPGMQQQTVDRDVVAAFWAICHLGRAWGVWPEGMLRRNDLITADDVVRLEDWLERISYAVLCVLDGIVDEAFDDYDRTWPAQ